jgi:aminoglycoside/choline kinase family phosphotransferase
MSQAPAPPAPQATTQSTVEWPTPARQSRFHAWFVDVQAAHGLQAETLRLASADASFRRYLRVESTQGSRIIMDAPPDKENCQPFAHVATLMQAAGLTVPQVLAWDEAQGFMLLSDLGRQTMMQVIDPAGAPPLELYLQAVDALVQWQLASRPDQLPPYDEALLRRELELFPQWYLGAHRKVDIDAAMRKTLDDAFGYIIQNNLSWPSVYVHRDFMPRNLMVPTTGAGQGNLGVLDFQDAVYGPITYDIASLMRDAFLSWEEDFCLDVTIRYWEKARKAGLPVGDDFGEFYRGVEWMGLQRHLKIAGIFARLTLRDGKPHYLADTPRFIGYLRTTCDRYRELKPLLRLIETVEGIASSNILAYHKPQAQ